MAKSESSKGYVPVGHPTAEQIRAALSSDTPGVELPYRIVRCKEAGVFAGYLLACEGDTVILLNARCLWYWKGALSLNEIAEVGPALPKECKFTVPAFRVKLLGVIEVLDVTPKAQKVIEGIAPWQPS
jgi:hypothetical protein